ncbi:uncharacterized protein LOC135487271 [Lineus longissimus]|uniref:uncharacterized protein LOC135487271 n=1 Tax=Lineus longissimus TaxID=88925 RepID=UPI002B4EB5F6
MFSVAILLVLAFGLPLCHSHSWVDIVGKNSGHMRGYRRGATDVDLQRYICVKPTLAECQPDPKHGITYTNDAMFPCRNDSGRIKATRIASGDKLYVMWMGNGHANQQSFGQPVDFYITPYKSEPAFSDFNSILQVPYFYCENGAQLCDRPKTDAKLSLPPQVGNYTLLWKWPFTDFIFGSCFDVEVLPSGSNLTPTAINTPSPAVGPIISYPYGTGKYLQYGCKFDVDCSRVGEEFCKLWQKDDCGRSICQGSVVALNPCLSVGGVTSSPANGCGAGSYCKCWKNPAVCHGSNAPCTCD